MEPVRTILDRGGWGGRLVTEFANRAIASANLPEGHTVVYRGPMLSNLLLACRWRELSKWDGTTATGGVFYGGFFFKKFLKNVGKLEGAEMVASMAVADKKKLVFIFVSVRAGVNDAHIKKVLKKERVETNTKFLQGVKGENNLDMQLLMETSTDGRVTQAKKRSKYLVSCQHHVLGKEPDGSEERVAEEANTWYGDINADDIGKGKGAGECDQCMSDAKQRIQAVAQGLYSISLTEVIPAYGYAARYTDKKGVIVQDMFQSYSKPDMVQVLQCLMSNPGDLHPAAVAEDQNLYWPIIWYWGSVHAALLEACGPATKDAVYARLGAGATFTRAALATALAAFPESAAGEWRVACGNEECPNLDHEIKFKMCHGCKVRRYCAVSCQKKDWGKHKAYCRAGREQH
jgi:hypothetical protein